MSKKIIIRNMTANGFTAMLEPIAFCEDVPSGKNLIVTCDFDDEIIIDISDDILVSVWAPNRATLAIGD